MEIAESARKHGVRDEDVRHAIRHVIAELEQIVDGDLRMLLVGPGTHGELLELVVVPSRAPRVVIHADRLRPKFYYLLDRRAEDV